MVIDCKAISQARRDAIKMETAELGITPTLAVILAVDDPALQVYGRNKRRACEEVGFNFEMYSDVGEVCNLVRRKDVHGILVQLPLPADIDADKVIAQIPLEKDVDALTAANMGRLVLGTYDMAPSWITYAALSAGQIVSSLIGATSLANRCLSCSRKRTPQ